MDYVKKIYKVNHILISFWTIFIGLGAVVGTLMFLLDPTEGFVMKEILPLLRSKMPFGNILFTNFIFSGISLLLVNGITNLTAFILIIQKKQIGYILGTIFGITLMLWICIQFYVFYPNLYLIDVIFFLFGLCQAICGYYAFVTFNELKFTFDVNDYPNINENKEIAVIYFSRMGYTKKLAYEKANELHCMIFEIKTKDKINSILGFWWCGRYSINKLEMPIEDESIDITKFHELYVFSPTWSFKICKPIISFFNRFSKPYPKINFTIIHFLSKPIKSLYKQAHSLFNSSLISYHEYSCHYGHYNKIK